eukprot:NODE_169_length_14535_cov_0.769881.p5 type:complete len:527 gc:universal NODE_169_length_14535_cov_0.769881:7443-5863(-)
MTDHIAKIKSEFSLSNPKPFEDGMRLDIDCRKLAQPANTPNLCGKIAKGQSCTNEICKYSHDVEEFEKTKPDNLPYTCPHGLDCQYGIKCRCTIHNEKTSIPLLNILDHESQGLLRKKKYAFEPVARIEKDINIDGYIKPTCREISAIKERKRTEMFKSGKTYCAPLTTHGHVAFRRLCKSFGADITCGEMALSTSILQGKNSDWLTFKRHASEENFGVQIAASKVDVVHKTCQLIRKHCQVDFVDLNICCPIDGAYQRGIGASLLSKKSQLEQILESMSDALSYKKESLLSMDTSLTDPEENVPLFTVKMRTGIKDGKNVAHEMIPVLENNGFDMASIHGRSREQRYSRLADWDYMANCSKLCNKMAFFGNGDVTSCTEYFEHMESTEINGILIARGALIKPWIFQEIKERKHIDKSATERLTMVKQFCDYGMEHFGTDSMGIEKVRRFFCEWWSFAHRYVPFPILERVPHQINLRPERWWGRNELETWMGSENPSDWIRLSEIFLGPSDANFTFKPKHKAQSYS